MNINERIKKIRESFCNDSNKEFAIKIEVAPNTANNYVRNGYSVGDGVLYRILEKFPEVNKSWLFDNKGDMLNESEVLIKEAILYLVNTSKSPTEISQWTDISSDTILEYIQKAKKPTFKHASKIVNYLKNSGEKLPKEKSDVKFYDPDNLPQGKKLIPLYDDVSTIGGKLEKGYSANMKSSYISPTEWIDPGDWFKGVTAAIRHYEESMIEYPSGCILALKEVQDWRLLIPGRNYVIETPEYRVTKKLQSARVNDLIVVYSTNEEKYENGELIHPPFPIPWELIGRIFEVLGYVVKTGSGSMVYTNQK